METKLNEVLQSFFNCVTPNCLRGLIKKYGLEVGLSPKGFRDLLRDVSKENSGLKEVNWLFLRCHFRVTPIEGLKDDTVSITFSPGAPKLKVVCPSARILTEYRV